MLRLLWGAGEKNRDDDTFEIICSGIFIGQLGRAVGQISCVYTDSYLEFWFFFCSFFFIVYRITCAHSIGETHPMLKTKSSFLCLMLYDIVRNSDAHPSGNYITKKKRP